VNLKQGPSRTNCRKRGRSRKSAQTVPLGTEVQNSFRSRRGLNPSGRVNRDREKSQVGGKSRAKRYGPQGWKYRGSKRSHGEAEKIRKKKKKVSVKNRDKKKPRGIMKSWHERW